MAAFPPSLKHMCGNNGLLVLLGTDLSGYLALNSLQNLVPAGAEGTVPNWYSQILAKVSDEESKRPIDAWQVQPELALSAAAQRGNKTS